VDRDVVDDIVLVRWEIRRMRYVCHCDFELETMQPIQPAIAARIVAKRRLTHLNRNYQRLMEILSELRRNFPTTNDFAPGTRRSPAQNSKK
jgi:hypothetical protein